jgi:hypothetical protein
MILIGSEGSGMTILGLWLMLIVDLMGQLLGDVEGWLECCSFVLICLNKNGAKFDKARPHFQVISK